MLWRGASGHNIFSTEFYVDDANAINLYDLFVNQGVLSGSILEVLKNRKRAMFCLKNCIM